jgi:hypothetical protein
MPAGRPTGEEPKCSNCGNPIYPHIPHFCDNDPEREAGCQQAADSIHKEVEDG